MKLKPIISNFKFIYYDSDGNAHDDYCISNLIKSVNLIVCNINIGIEVTWSEIHNKEWIDEKERFHLLKIEQKYNTSIRSDGLIFHIQDVPKVFSIGFKEYIDRENV